MNDLWRVWGFTRTRLDQAIDGLTESGARWRMHPSCHTIAELLLHIAGAEYYWSTRMLGREPADSRLDRAVIDAFLQPGSFPYSEDECSLAFGQAKLAETRLMIEPIFRDLPESALAMRMISPVGDEVTGHEGLTRLAQHAGYHTGQIWMVKMHPEFPS